MDTKELKAQYDLELKSGMFWEWYPALTGEWEKDRENWLFKKKQREALIEIMEADEKSGLYEEPETQSKEPISYVDWHQRRDKMADQYSRIEQAIIEWSNDGTKTAGELTRQIFEILSK